ncbi:MAG: TIGR02186 family protein [Proteobacteria bacterium]|nr:TIGR02186 family protein [Pseudomonadota bacterium]
MRTLLPLALLAMLCLPSAVPSIAQQTLVADLDKRQVSITTDFTGADLLLFGAHAQSEGSDLVILVEGPTSEVAIRRKERVGGIWVNTETATLVDVPSFYQISSTRPLTTLTDKDTLAELRLGMVQLPFRLAAHSAISEGHINDWRAALIRNMEAKGLWNEDANVNVRENVLFHSNIRLPANVLPGEYGVRILHFREGVMVDETQSRISVAKSGLSADIYRFAHQNSVFYGIFAVVFAVAAGWLAAWVSVRFFRR